MTLREKARDLAQGKWRSVLSTLGVDESALDQKHHPCPKDGSGEDRFRFADREGSGSYFCACSNGDKGGMALLMCCRGWDYATAASEVEKIVGGAVQAKPANNTASDPVRSLRSIQSKLQPAGDAVRAYLSSRHLDAPPTIKQARLPYWKDGRIAAEYDSMVARVVSAEGSPLTFHITYLQDGKKAPIDPSRKLMTPVSPINGGAIRLFPAAEEMGVAEGIETAMAASLMYGIPVWSCISEALLQAFDPLPTVRKLWIFGDNDANYVGQSAAYGCARRLSKRNVECLVMLPDRVGDWNDVLRESREAANG